MEWHYYLSSFFAGMFLANFVPHFINGISGNRFPTPFAKPSGRGLSSPTTNVVWALVNLLIGFLLFRMSKISMDDNLMLIVFFAGIACMSIFSSKGFSHKEKDGK